MLVRLAILPLAAGLLLAAGARSAEAVCTAAQIIAVEASCPAVGTDCIIAGQHTIDDGCTLDFSGRQLTILGSGGLSVGSGSFTLQAARLTLAGRLAGIGSGPGARGGMIVVETTGDVSIPASGSIDVRGNRSGGDVFIRSGANITIAGRVLARDMTGLASGGLIVIQATGNISTTAAATISAQGGIQSDGGGEIDITAGGNVTLLNQLMATGYDGGFIIIEAGGTASMAGADSSGRGDGGSGGCVDLVAGSGAQVSGKIDVSGTDGEFGGGCGGLVCLDGGLGEMRIASGALIDADGGISDGGGGQVAVLARGNVVINGIVQARGPQSYESCGGDVCVDAGVDAQVSNGGALNVSGGDAGGDLEVAAGRDIAISAAIDARGHRRGALGGDVTVRAGLKGRGSLSFVSNSTINISSAPTCSVENGCGQAGLADIVGCNITLNGSINATGPDGGEVLIIARDQLITTGAINANNTNNNGGFPGFNRIIHRGDRAPMLQTNVITPPPQLLAVATCPATGPTEPSCLAPCPICGNGMIEFPETCDLGVMPPVSCGGCSAFCVLEDCDDDRTCTGDSCHPQFGCSNVPTPVCQEPTATVTGTPPTATATRTSSPTPPATATGTVTSTPTPSLTPTATGTPTASGTASQTTTASATVPATATATAVASATATAPATATATAEVTATLPPSCPGDCDGSGVVTINELIIGVNIALGSATTSACPAFDRNDDGTVSINELIAAVSATLSGC